MSREKNKMRGEVNKTKRRIQTVRRRINRDKVGQWEVIIKKEADRKSNGQTKRRISNEQRDIWRNKPEEERRKWVERSIKGCRVMVASHLCPEGTTVYTNINTLMSQRKLESQSWDIHKLVTKCARLEARLFSDYGYSTRRERKQDRRRSGVRQRGNREGGGQHGGVLIMQVNPLCSYMESFTTPGIWSGCSLLSSCWLLLSLRYDGFACETPGRADGNNSQKPSFTQCPPQSMHAVHVFCIRYPFTHHSYHTDVSWHQGSS